MSQDLLLARILSGVIILRDFLVKPPSRIDRYATELWLEEERLRLRFDEWLSKAEVENVLKFSGKLQNDYEKKLVTLTKLVEDRKYEMYKCGVAAIKQIELIRKNLRSLEGQINSIYQVKHSLDHMTLEGHLEGLKSRRLFEAGLSPRTPQDLAGKRDIVGDDNAMGLLPAYSGPSGRTPDVDALYKTYLYSQVSIDNIRELSRGPVWRTLWNADSRNVFGLPTADWTDEQRVLVNFTRMYDSAYKHPEMPPENVFEDDDLFDGWMIAQKRDRDKEKGGDEKGGDTFVFANKTVLAEDEKGFYRTSVPITSKDELDEFRSTVEDTNTSEAKRIKKLRQDALKKSGKLEEAQLPDVKAKLAMASNEMFKQKVMGK